MTGHWFFCDQCFSIVIQSLGFTSYNNNNGILSRPGLAGAWKLCLLSPFLFFSFFLEVSPLCFFPPPFYFGFLPISIVREYVAINGHLFFFFLESKSMAKKKKNALCRYFLQASHVCHNAFLWKAVGIKKMRSKGISSIEHT